MEHSIKMYYHKDNIYGKSIITTFVSLKFPEPFPGSPLRH